MEFNYMILGFISVYFVILVILGVLASKHLKPRGFLSRWKET